MPRGLLQLNTAQRHLYCQAPTQARLSLALLSLQKSPTATHPPGIASKQLATKLMFGIQAHLKLIRQKMTENQKPPISDAVFI